LLYHYDNYIERLSVDDNFAKSFNIPVINVSILYNYFDNLNKIIFRSVSKISEDLRVMAVSLSIANAIIMPLYKNTAITCKSSGIFEENTCESVLKTLTDLYLAKFSDTSAKSSIKLFFPCET